MIRLDTTTRKLQVKLGGAPATNQLPCVASWADKSAAGYSGGTSVVNTSGTTAVDVVPAPAASTVRDVDHVTVRNSDTAAVAATVQYNDNATTYVLWSGTLNVGDTLEYTHAGGWRTTVAPFAFNVAQWNGVAPDAALVLADGMGNPKAPFIGSGGLLWNGSTWDRAAGNLGGTLLASATRTANVNVAGPTNRNGKGVIVFLNISSAGTGNLTVAIYAADPVTGNGYQVNSAPPAVTTAGQFGYAVYPGITSAPGTGGGNIIQATSGILSKDWSVTVFHNSTGGSNWTYALYYSLIL